MAKPFYSMDEVCARLAKNADAVRVLVRDGKLREFRDAGKVFFKAEDVDKLAASARSKTGSGEILLDSTDDMPPSVKDPGASDSITLEPIGDEEETKRKKEGTVITASGISVFDDDELEIDADPMAKTRIAGATVGDEVPIESGSGSGSGLLDLTREADDTSLGAELLDEIYPGEDEVAQSKPTPARARDDSDTGMEEPEAAIEDTGGGEVVIQVYDSSYDPSEAIFSGILVGALIVMVLGASVVGGVLQGYLPSYGLTLSNNFLFFLLGAVVVVGISTLLGWIIGKAGSPRRA